MIKIEKQPKRENPVDADELKMDLVSRIKKPNGYLYTRHVLLYANNNAIIRRSLIGPSRIVFQAPDESLRRNQTIDFVEMVQMIGNDDLEGLRKHTRSFVLASEHLLHHLNKILPIDFILQRKDILYHEVNGHHGEWVFTLWIEGLRYRQYQIKGDGSIKEVNLQSVRKK